MDHISHFKSEFEPSPVLRKIVLILFLKKLDVDYLDVCGLLRNYINRF